jgi:hypothetical protein
VCNGVATCLGGTCTPGTPPDCDDANPCTTDVCDAVLGCEHPAVPNDTPCADGTVCNGTETCQAGSCTAGTPLDCDDGAPCTTDSCAPALGCQNLPAPDGTTCTDATVCNGDETCQGGACTAGTPLDCDDGDPCTIDTCDASAGCQHPQASNGTSCADDTLCNGNEICLAGTCVAGVPPVCDDLNPCTADSCDPLLGCRNPAEPNGTPCGVGMSCDNGVCL